MVELTLRNELPLLLPFTLVSLEASGYLFTVLYLFTCLKSSWGIMAGDTFCLREI